MDVTFNSILELCLSWNERRTPLNKDFTGLPLFGYLILRYRWFEFGRGSLECDFLALEFLGRQV